jgi:hypothetical protein
VLKKIPGKGVQNLEFFEAGMERWLDRAEDNRKPKKLFFSFLSLGCIKLFFISPK